MTYVTRTLERIKLCSPTDAQTVEGEKFDIYECPRNEIERKQMKNVAYASEIGSLNYAQICTHPDISFAVGMFERYHNDPGMEH